MARASKRLKNCEQCNQPFVGKTSNSRFCSLTCYIDWVRAVGQTTESNARRSASMKRSCAQRGLHSSVELSCNRCGKTIWVRSGRKHHFCSRTCFLLYRREHPKEFVGSEESNLKRSKTQALNILEGRSRTTGRGRGERVTFAKGGEVYCRSQLEVRYGRLLDADPNVVEFLHEKVKVGYLYEGKQRWTVIDFLVKYATGMVTFDEVKPEWVVEKDRRTRAKMLAARAFAESLGFTYRWWTGDGYPNNLARY